MCILSIHPLLDRGQALQCITPVQSKQVVRCTIPIEPLNKKMIREVCAGAAFTLFLTGILGGEY